MMEFLVYDGKVAVVLLAFYLFYRFLLKKETFHRFNRVVLVGTAVLSFLLPLCIITIHRPMETSAAAPVEPVIVSELPEMEATQTLQASQPWWPVALTILFWMGVAFVLTRVVISILSIIKVISQGEQAGEENGCKIIVTERDIDPFSWMKYIVLSRKDWEGPHESVLTHEKAHIGFRHSIEILLVDVLSALQWFNPALWMLRADLQELHEYEADDAVLRSGTNIKEYQYLLIRKAVSKSGYSVANSFNHSILKNRITMMSKSKSPLSRGLRVLWMLPLVCLAIGLQARTVYVPVDKDSENLISNETATLSGSVWKGEHGDLSFFDKTFEIRSENFVISGDYSLEGSTVTLTFKKVRNETTGKEKQGEDSLTGAIEGDILTIRLDKGTETFRRVVPDEISNHVLPEVTVVKYAPAHVKAEDIIHVSDLENFKATGETDFDIAPKCSENFALWLNSRLHYPADCLYEGTVLTMFEVGTNGKVSDVRIVVGVCDELNEAVKKLIGKSPAWTPAKKDGKPVATILFQPVVFSIRTSPTAASTVSLTIRADGTLESGGKEISINELPEYIRSLNVPIPGTTVLINADANTPMGYIEDLRNQLREAGALKVNYAKPGASSSVPRRLPPSPKMEGVLSTDEALAMIDRNHICVVRINANDKVFFENGAYDKEEDMLRIGKAFLKKHGTKSCFVLGCYRGTSYAAFQNMQALLYQIYTEVRDEKAMEVYGKPMAHLTQDERDAILRLVPINILETDMIG